MNLLRIWRKVLAVLYVFIVLHFLKDVTQDILGIPTYLDMMGDIKEQLSTELHRRIFTWLGILSFVLEVFLLAAIPVIYRRKRMTYLEEGVILAVAYLFFYFITVSFLDPLLYNGLASVFRW